MTVLEKLRKLDEERGKLLEEATATALANTNKALDELNGLGYDYRLVRGNLLGGGKKKQQDAASRHCEICDMQGHDKRNHRSQGDKKRKFTPAELQKLGLG